MNAVAKLVVVGGDVKTSEIKLRTPATIGRGRECSIMLAQALVSRKHCEITEAGGKIVVKDLGSLNGTFVNNQRVTESPLEPGQLLTIGTVTFRLELAEIPADGMPPTAPQASGGTVANGLPKDKAADAKALPPLPIDAQTARAEQFDDDFGDVDPVDFDPEDFDIGDSSSNISDSSQGPPLAQLPVAFAAQPAPPLAKPAAPVAQPAAPQKPAGAAKPGEPGKPADPKKPASPWDNLDADADDEEDDLQDFLKNLK